jgi:hypothetical protein
MFRLLSSTVNSSLSAPKSTNWLSLTLRRGFKAVPTRDFEPALTQWTQNARLKSWIATNVKLMAPDSVHFCDGELASESPDNEKTKKKMQQESEKKCRFSLTFQSN